MPNRKIKDKEKLILSIYNRCLKYFNKEIVETFIYNERSTFPLTGCGKRSNRALQSEEIPRTALIVNEENEQLQVSEYYKENSKKRVKKL